MDAKERLLNGLADLLNVPNILAILVVSAVCLLAITESEIISANFLSSLTSAFVTYSVVRQNSMDCRAFENIERVTKKD